MQQLPLLCVRCSSSYVGLSDGFGVLWDRHTLPPSFGLWVGWCGLVMCVAVKGWVSHVLNALSILSFLQWRFSVLLGAMDSLNDVKLHS